MMPRGPICFLSDYGLDDEFVGVVHRVLADEAPGIPVIDVTHRIAPGDIRGGALTLSRAAPWLAPAVILAVVDPGVGTTRRAVAVETAGPRPVVLVGPDNGLLFPASLSLGGITSAVELDPKLRRASSRAQEAGPTFDGRDLFAPAAARLAAGAELAALGNSVDPASLEGHDLVPPAPETIAGGALSATVLWVDRFGNAQLNVTPADARHLSDALEVDAGSGERWTARRVGAFADLEAGELGLIADSYGQLALCLRGESAARLLGIGAGAIVMLAPPAASSH